ncbi:hypothetical protein E1B28_006276 [Marasmius oreades]|uniref:Major facilitator superfamily (MFS) profile domain-containing protein n=1 Tax=Marasmius oreades TaxID=181124 RepID=A0A9P7UVF3_9AGAR|nr:uncharacterized protein E1B28_006276 [Marasmius oreades]KAG7095538.1 hypothetical protein E1B28_006276 [Marasmius oreades]
MRDGAFIVSIAAACLVAFGLFFPYFYLQLYGLDKALNADLAFYAIAILNAGSIVGRLLPNSFADRVGSYNLIVPCLLATSVLLFTMLSVHTSAGLVVFGLLYGCMSGSYLSLIPSIIAQLSKNSGQPGLRMGFAFTNVGFCMLLGTPIEGALLHGTSARGFVWTRTVIFSGVMVLSGAIGMLVSRFLHVRAQGSGTPRQLV